MCSREFEELSHWGDNQNFEELYTYLGIVVDMPATSKFASE